MILPGSTIGILGGGQLGRMTALAARSLGYGVVVFDPDPGSPARAAADELFTAPFTDIPALERFASACDVITLEFENIPAATLRHLQTLKPVRPGVTALEICQHREREKNFLRDNGFPCAKFKIADSAESLREAAESLGYPCVAKTAAFGYDGKGQRKIHSVAEAESVWTELASGRLVVEEWVHFQLELSVICARNARGETAVFPPSENLHRNHILDTTLAPGRFSAEIARQAAEIARALTEKLQVEGLLAVELFLTADAHLVVNEMAPRPHNSGHYTLDACTVSQFEQHVRAVCDLPLGSTELMQPAAMINLLGDSWSAGEPDWNALLSFPRAALHLYGKKEARPGRKMGHFTVLDTTLEEALERAENIRSAL